MLLSDLNLIEVSARKINFEYSILVPGQGKIKVEYGELNFEAGGELTEDETKGIIRVNAFPSIKGFREIQSDPDFSLNLNIGMLYVYPKEKMQDSEIESFLQENVWYFASFLRTYFKVYVDNILSTSTINGVKLPFN